MSEIQQVSLWVIVNGIVHDDLIDPRLLLSDYLLGRAALPEMRALF
jgi:carbon-monoxide dehydrogenase small subunit